MNTLRIRVNQESLSDFSLNHSTLLEIILLPKELKSLY